MPINFDWPFPEKSGPVYKVVSTFTISLVGTLSKIWIKGLNSFHIQNGEILVNAVLKRDPNTALVTVANHHSCMDDPLLFGGSLPLRAFFNRSKMRWNLGADDIVFTTRRDQTFFSLGKTIPIVRGDGVHQRSMDFAIEQLNQNEWVHIFPEGKVNLSKELIRLKWGVGRLIAEAQNCPLVIPFYHLGMDSVLPNRTPYIPHIRQKVSVYVGEPLHFEDLIQKMKKDNCSLQEIRKAITDNIQAEFAKLKVKCEELHRKHLGEKLE